MAVDEDDTSVPVAAVDGVKAEPKLKVEGVEVPKKATVVAGQRVFGAGKARYQDGVPCAPINRGSLLMCSL